eukprot:3829143-Amphidinium_carterae.1
MQKSLRHYGHTVPKAVPPVGEEEFARRSASKGRNGQLEGQVWLLKLVEARRAGGKLVLNRSRIGQHQQGLTNAVLPPHADNVKVHFTKSHNHWATDDNLIELLSFMDGYVNHAEGLKEQPWIFILDFAPIHVAKSFRKRASEEFNHIKFVFVEAGSTGFSQPADLAVVKVFKSEAKALACAAYARDVLNMTDAIFPNHEQRHAARREQKHLPECVEVCQAARREQTSLCF